MCNILQVELTQYIEGHNFEAIKQDNGVVVLIPCYRGTEPNFIHLGNEAHYCETYREARTALGY